MADKTGDLTLGHSLSDNFKRDCSKEVREGLRIYRSFVIKIRLLEQGQISVN